MKCSNDLLLTDGYDNNTCIPCTPYGNSTSMSMKNTSIGCVSTSPIVSMATANLSTKESQTCDLVSWQPENNLNHQSLLPWQLKPRNYNFPATNQSELDCLHNHGSSSHVMSLPCQPYTSEEGNDVWTLISDGDKGDDYHDDQASDSEEHFLDDSLIEVGNPHSIKTRVSPTSHSQSVIPSNDALVSHDNYPLPLNDGIEELSKDGKLKFIFTDPRIMDIDCIKKDMDSFRLGIWDI